MKGVHPTMKMTLLESVIINPAEVDEFSRRWDRAIKFPEGKAWMYKRVRQILMNGDKNYLIPQEEHQIPPGSPAYIMAAIDRGETVYKFAKTAALPGISQLINQADIIVDFLNGNYDTANRAVDPTNMVAAEDQILAKKTLAKLDRMNWLQAEQAAQTWANRVSKRSLKLNKDGGEVIMQWPNGYYAIRFTNRDTMMRDGAQLQNCLASGTYWDRVVSGDQMVIAIRKPNDEAVVGLRFTADGSNIYECKGKNNKTITAGYIDYVVDLLTSFQTKNQTSDLSSAGITFNKDTGRYGTFKDIATKVFDKNGVRVFETDSSGIVEIKKRDEFSYAIRNGVMTSMTAVGEGDILDTNVDDIVGILNIVGRGAAADFQNTMAKIGVYYNDGKWGDVTTVGTFIGDFAPSEAPRLKAYLVGNDGDGNHMVDGSIILRFENGRQGVYSITDGKVTSCDRNAGSLNSHYISEIFNNADIRADNDFEDTYLHIGGWAYSPKDNKYIHVIINDPDATFDEGNKRCNIFQVSDTNIWLLQTIDPFQYRTLRVIKGKIELSNLGVSRHTPGAAIRWMLENGHAKAAPNPVAYAIAPEGKGKGSKQLWNPLDVAAKISKMPEEARVHWPMDIIGGDFETQKYLTALEQYKLFTPEVQREFAKALTPTQSFYIKRKKDYSFAGMKVEKIEIKIPSTLMQMHAQGMFTDPKVSAYAEKIKGRIERDVSKFFEENKEYAYYEDDGSNWPWSTFTDFIYKQNEQMGRKIVLAKKNAMSNPSTSIEDKFAALNTDYKINRNRR